MSVQQILHDLRGAVERDDRNRVVRLTEQMLDEFEQARAREKAMENAARSIRGTAAASGSNATVTAQSAIDAAARANQAKINVDTAVLDYVGGGDRDDLLETLESAIETHDALDERFERLRDEAADVDHPPAVGVTAPNQLVVPKGERVDEAITVRNDGVVDVEDIALEIDSDAGIALSRSSVERLDAGETTDVGLEGTATSADVFRPEVTATVDNVENDETFYLHVQTKRTFLEQAVDDLVQLYSEIAGAAAAVDHAGTKKQNGNSRGDDDSDDNVVPSGLENKMRGIIGRTIEIVGRIENGATDRSVDNQIRAVSNELGALAAQIEAKAGTKLRAADAPRLRRDVEAIVEVYEDARTAEA